MKERLPAGGVFTVVVRDSDGNPKKLWNYNLLGLLLLKWFRLHTPKNWRLFGFWDDKLVMHNLVVNAGLAGVASKLAGAGGEADFDYLAVGTGTTGVVAGDTTLETEITDSGLARAQDSSPTRSTTTVTNDTAEMNYQWSVSGTKAVTEAGVLNAASSGTLLARQTFAAQNVASGDTYELTYKFQITAA